MPAQQDDGQQRNGGQQGGPEGNVLPEGPAEERPADHEDQRAGQQYINMDNQQDAERIENLAAGIGDRGEELQRVADVAAEHPDQDEDNALADKDQQEAAIGPLAREIEQRTDDVEGERQPERPGQRPP